MAAIGWPLAIKADGIKYLRWIALSLPTGLAFGALLVAMFSIIFGIEQLWNKRSKHLRRVVSVCGWGALVALFLIALWIGKYSEAQKRLGLTAPVDNGSTITEQVLDAQRETLVGASTAARNAIASLDSNAEELNRLRANLAKTLADIEQQRRAAATVNQTARRLEEQQENLRDRLSYLRTLLHNNEPISRSDLIASQRIGLLQGLILGMVTSVAGTYAFRWIERRRRKPAESNGIGSA